MENIFENLIQQMLESKFGVVDNFLSPELSTALSNNLIDHRKADELKRAGIGKKEFFQLDKSYRTDQIHWLDNQSKDPAERPFFNLIDQFVQYLNRTCFTALRSWEFHYALYEKGSFYKRHLDQFQNDSGRQFSIVTYLNEEWESNDGGQLVLYLPEGEHTILPKAGRMVFFKSDEIEHEVLPANRDRMSVTGWLKDK